MNFEPIEKIANAVLYEGFLLYPYRRSAVKNQQRWHFGTLGPKGGEDPTEMQTECLVEALPESAPGNPVIDLKIRFLQDEIERELTFSRIAVGSAQAAGYGNKQKRNLADLAVSGESVVRESLKAAAQTRSFSFPPIEGRVEIEFASIADEAFRFTVRILNSSLELGSSSRMLSTHTLLAVEGGAFISLLDPPENYRAAAAACRNIATWPVLAGVEGDRSLMLSSPIILYDYPQIAPESQGEFFDGTEMDEMLTLRVLTLSDEEKSEVRAGSERGREILERTEKLPAEQLAKLHGAIRSLRNSTKLAFREGDRVRLRPRKKADIFDIALDGKIAIIESVECDFEDRIHLAVTVEDDPGREFGIARQIAHRFFFSPDEVELV